MVSFLPHNQPHSYSDCNISDVVVAVSMGYVSCAQYCGNVEELCGTVSSLA